MSPVSRKRTKKHSSKHPGRRSGSPVDPIYLSLERSLRWSLRTPDPLESELVVSELLGALRGGDGVHPAVPSGPLDAIIDDLAARATPVAGAALVAIAHLAPAEPSRELARRRLDGLTLRGVPLPTWAEAIDAWTPGRVMLLADAFGDQANVIVEFDGAGRSHALAVLVDFSHLGAWCKDLFVADDVAEVRTSMAREALASEAVMRSVPLDPAAARFLVERALAATDMTHEPDVGDTFTATHAFALARLRLLPAVSGEVAGDDVTRALRAAGLPVPSPLADPVVVGPPERDALVRRFLDSRHAGNLVGAAPDVVEHLARVIVDYGCDYDDGRVLRVSPAKLANLLLGWMPRRLVLNADDRAAVPSVIGAWVEFALAGSTLPPRAVVELRAALPDLLADFAIEYDNPKNFGPARALFDGIGEFSSAEELEALLAGRVVEHNAQLAAGWTFRVRVDLVGAKPPIWRRLELPGSITLAQLHEVLQVAFDWDNSHLHEFTAGRTRYGVPDGDSLGGAQDERLVTMGQLLDRPGAHLDYEYDFGDSWKHRLVVEQIDYSGTAPVAMCTGGRRAAPVEDSGGFDPAGFDPAAFDPAALNRALAALPLG